MSVHEMTEEHKRRALEVCVMPEVCREAHQCVYGCALADYADVSREIALMGARREIVEAHEACCRAATDEEALITFRAFLRIVGRGHAGGEARV